MAVWSLGLEVKTKFLVVDDMNDMIRCLGEINSEW